MLRRIWQRNGIIRDCSSGSPREEIQSAVVTLDVTMDTVDYAIKNKVNLIISHHPVIFQKLSSLRTDTYDGLMYEKLLSHHISVYSAHTNWDSAEHGVNDILARKIGLRTYRASFPFIQIRCISLLYMFPKLRRSRAQSSGGRRGRIYRELQPLYVQYRWGRSVQAPGRDHPFIGNIGKLERTKEIRIETIIPASRLNLLLSAVRMAHPYEEPAFDIYPLVNKGKSCYIGRIGKLAQPEPARMVLRKIKRALGIQILTYAGPEDIVVEKVALCGGAGASFIGEAAAAGAQLYLTGDVKYHEAQDAVKRGMVIADGGHYGTEVISVPVLAQRLQNAAKERAGRWLS